MPNQFKGQVFDSNGNKLSGVKVSITGPSTIPPNTSTTTDVNGNWLITLKVDIDPKNVTIAFSKPGLETTSIKNPQQTAILPGYIDPEKGGTLDLAGDYPSGKWKVTSLPQETQDVINKEIEDAYTFTKNNPGNFILEIESSESQVPNADNENTGRNFSKPGSLAKARAEALQEYINDKINTLYVKETNPSFPKPIIILGKIDKVGDEPWDRVDANANKYTKDQYTRISAKFLTQPDCKWEVAPEPIIAGAFVPIRNNGASNIQLDAAVAPDVFIIRSKKSNGSYIEKQTPTYIQNPNAPASPISWGLLAYISDATGKLPQQNIQRKYSTPLQTKTISIQEANGYIHDGILKDTSNTFRNNIYQLFGKEGSIEDIIKMGLTRYFGQGPVTYYVVDRSYYTFPLTQDGITGNFEIKAINGTYIGGSSFLYRMCK